MLNIFSESGGKERTEEEVTETRVVRGEKDRGRRKGGGGGD